MPYKRRYCEGTAITHVLPQLPLLYSFNTSNMRPLGKILLRRISALAGWSFVIGTWSLFTSILGFLMATQIIGDFDLLQLFSVFVIWPWSLFTGFTNLHYVYVFHWLLSVTPILLGLTALRSLSQDANTGGRGLARLGVLLGILAMFFWTVIISSVF